LQASGRETAIEVTAMTQRKLYLPEPQKIVLVRLRDTAPKAYMRERAAALLKIAEGIPAAVVARERVLRPRKPGTV